MAKDTRYVNGAAKLARRINTIQENLSLPPLMEEIGGLLLRRTKERFAREVDPDGQPWKELAPATLERKRQLGFGDKQKLERTSAMRKAIKVLRGRADGGMFTNTGAGFRIGIDDPEIAAYAVVQNRGSRDGRIPARRFLGIGRLDVRAVDSFMRRRAIQLGLTV